MEFEIFETVYNRYKYHKCKKLVDQYELCFQYKKDKDFKDNKDLKKCHETFNKILSYCLSLV